MVHNNVRKFQGELKMVNIAFSDEIVNATELRNNQKHWLDMASRIPVTIAYGRHSLAIINRERIARLMAQNHYLEIAVKLYADNTAGKSSDVLPWVEYLDENERREFLQEFINAIKLAIAGDDWDSLENLLDDWRATAETLQDKSAVRALTTRGRRDKYIALK
jgi:hypothetical protein